MTKASLLVKPKDKEGREVSLADEVYAEGRWQGIVALYPGIKESDHWTLRTPGGRPLYVDQVVTREAPFEKDKP